MTLTNDQRLSLLEYQLSGVTAALMDNLLHDLEQYNNFGLYHSHLGWFAFCGDKESHYHQSPYDAIEDLKEYMCRDDIFTETSSVSNLQSEDESCRNQ